MSKPIDYNVSGQKRANIAVEAMKRGVHDSILKDDVWLLVPELEREMGNAKKRARKKQSERQSQNQLISLDLLMNITDNMAGNNDICLLAQKACQTVTQSFGVGFVCLGAVDENGSLRPLAMDGDTPEFFQLSVLPLDEMSKEPCNDSRGQPPQTAITANDVPGDEENAKWSRRLLGSGYYERLADKWSEVLSGIYSSYASFTLKSGGEAFGVLCICDDKEGFLGPDHRALLETYANIVAYALRNADLLTKTQRQLERLNGLHAIDAAITSSMDLPEVLSIILDQVMSQMGIAGSTILLYDAHTKLLTNELGRGDVPLVASRTGIPLGQGHAGRAAQKGKVNIVPDLADTAIDSDYIMELAEEGFEGYGAVPLIARDQLKGVLEVFLRTEAPEDREWLKLLETMASQTAIAIDNCELFEGLKSSNINLALAYDTTIEGWSRALDLRDKETEGHSQRVTVMAVDLAIRMGVDVTEIAHLRRGALLHDIGKMGVPDGILLKPGPLTDEEWLIMRRHPVHAFELLSHISYLEKALAIPYYHHEKWAGTGYPKGLKGEEIPLAARIFAVADVYDALTSDRPYRAAWTRERALAYIASESGTYFDPHVVEIFQELQSGHSEPPGLSKY